MRILLTSDACGGVGVFTEELAAALMARGHQVLVVVFSPTEPALKPQMHQLWARFRLEWMDNGGSAEVAADAHGGRTYLANLARQWQPDLLHSNHFALVGAAPAVPTLLSVHSDVVSWWRTVRGRAPPETAFQRWYYSIATQALDGAALVVAPSRAALQDVRASFQVSRPTRVIHNGRSPGRFASQAKKPLAIAAGRLWDPAKQLYLLGELQDLRRLELAVAGDGRHPVQDVVVAAPRGVQALGQLMETDLSVWMGQARAYVGTSLYEPFGLAVLEAALSGCALLLNDIPSWRELWGAVGCFYRSLGELEALLHRVADQAAWAAARGEAARRHARRHYTAARMASAYESAYRSLI